MSTISTPPTLTLTEARIREHLVTARACYRDPWIRIRPDFAEALFVELLRCWAELGIHGSPPDRAETTVDHNQDIRK